MKLTRTGIEGAWLLETDPIEDERGFFLETYRDTMIGAELGRPYRFAQGNHSRSTAGTLRGFRVEPWDKLIYVARGTALCVVVDPRPESPTFRQHTSALLGDAPGQRQRLLVSRGLSNAFYCLTEVDYLNDVSAEYDPDVRLGFRWDDPTLAIEWPSLTPLLSSSDRQLPTLDEMLSNRCASSAHEAGKTK